MVSITRPERFRFARLKRSHIALTTISLLLVLDLGRSINARIDGTAKVEHQQQRNCCQRDVTALEPSKPKSFRACYRYHRAAPGGSESLCRPATSPADQPPSRQEGIPRDTDYQVKPISADTSRRRWIAADLGDRAQYIAQCSYGL